MKILFLTFGPRTVASSRTRVFQYLSYINKDHIKHKILVYNTDIFSRVASVIRSDDLISKILRRVAWKIIHQYNFLYRFYKIISLCVLAKFYDIVFIQKVFLPPFIIKVIKKLYKKKLVLDFDDAVYLEKTFTSPKRFRRLLPLFDLVILASPHTEKYIHKLLSTNTIVIDTPIDIRRYSSGNKSIREKIVIGWIGSGSTQKYLLILGGILKRLCNKNPKVIFEFIGAHKLDHNGVRLRKKRWSLQTEVKHLQNFDIGIMPLPDDEWTRGKGGYKLLQYMAVGIPCVASPVGINRELIKDGKNGFLATTENEWFEKLSLLIKDAELRERMGMKGRELAVKNYSFEVAAPKLISALKRLI